MALLTWDVAGNKADLLVVDAGIAHRKTISTGNSSGDKVEVASGLTAGTLVITRGGFNVKDGEKVNVTRVNGEK
jgi:glycine/serine hydroxymethyltransferase